MSFSPSSQYQEMEIVKSRCIAKQAKLRGSMACTGVGNGWRCTDKDRSSITPPAAGPRMHIHTDANHLRPASTYTFLSSIAWILALIIAYFFDAAYIVMRGHPIHSCIHIAASAQPTRMGTCAEDLHQLQ